MPRFVFWTIVLGEEPTAFRAKERDELLATLKQLQKHHPEATIKWFARGRFWNSQEEDREDRAREREGQEGRPRSWRPGGEHRTRATPTRRSPATRSDATSRRSSGGRSRTSRETPGGAPPALDRAINPGRLGGPAPSASRGRTAVATGRRARKANASPGAIARPAAKTRRRR